MNEVKKRMPRGIRNNNPLNIKKSRFKWVGTSETQNDPVFVQFDSMKYGLRAAFKILLTYSVVWKCRTLQQYISRWAPPEENDTLNYITFVGQALGIHSWDLIDWDNREQMVALVMAMCMMEGCGAYVKVSEVREAYDMLVDENMKK